MRYDFAPMEGVTDSIYRALHARYFSGVDRYYTPFFSPTVHRALTPREQRELPRRDEISYALVPQILTKVPEDFLWMARQCRDRGYDHVNLNLGCPSGTVTAKGKGSGMLDDPEHLDAFFDAIFAQTPVEISVKTRLGLNDPEDFPEILEVYNRYPLKELTLHPRVRKDFYVHPVRMEWVDYAVAHSAAPVSYNGNLCSQQDIEAFHSRYPGISAVMIGRGLIGDPGMLGHTDRGTLEAFMDGLLEEYLSAFGGARNAMFRLKEHWRYLICRFENSRQLGKRLRKTTDLAEYRAITHEIFATLPLADRLHPDW